GSSCSAAWGSPCSIADRMRVTSLIGRTKGSGVSAPALAREPQEWDAESLPSACGRVERPNLYPLSQTDTPGAGSRHQRSAKAELVLRARLRAPIPYLVRTGAL